MDAYNGEVGTNFLLQIEPYAATMPCALEPRNAFRRSPPARSLSPRFPCVPSHCARARAQI